MRRIKVAQVLHAPRDLVFGAWTDYNAWPGYSVIYSRVAGVERYGDAATFRAEVKVRHGHVVAINHPRGRPATRTERHVLTPFEKVEVEADTDGIRSESVWKFEAIPEGTMVTADVYAPVHGWAILAGPVARSMLQSLLRQELQGFAKSVEAKTLSRA